MKNLIVLFIVLSVVVSSCSKKNSDYLPPIIEFGNGVGIVSGDTTLKLGEPFNVKVMAENPNVNLTNFIIKVETGSVSEVFLDSGMNTPKLSYQKTLIKGIEDNEKWIFIIRDRDGKSSEISLTVSMDTSSSFGNINYYPDITLGAQNNGLPSFFSIDQNTSYFLSSAFLNQDVIDLCYYYDFVDTDKNTIASPGANIDESVYMGEYGLNNWTIRRTSRFKIANVSVEDFQNASNDSLLIAAHGQSDGNRKAKNLQEGNLFAFKNEEGKIGIFMVNSIVGTDEGIVNISIKVQE